MKWCELDETELAAQRILQLDMHGPEEDAMPDASLKSRVLQSATPQSNRKPLPDFAEVPAEVSQGLSATVGPNLLPASASPGVASAQDPPPATASTSPFFTSVTGVASAPVCATGSGSVPGVTGSASYSGPHAVACKCFACCAARCCKHTRVGHTFPGSLSFFTGSAASDSGPCLVAYKCFDRCCKRSSLCHRFSGSVPGVTGSASYSGPHSVACKCFARKCTARCCKCCCVGYRSSGFVPGVTGSAASCLVACKCFAQCCTARCCKCSRVGDRSPGSLPGVAGSLQWAPFRCLQVLCQKVHRQVLQARLQVLRFPAIAGSAASYSAPHSVA